MAEGSVDWDGVVQFEKASFVKTLAMANRKGHFRTVNSAVS